MVCDLVKLRGVVLCSLWSLSIAQAQGYRVEPGRVVVEGADWQGWTVTPGTMQINSEGVQPQFIRDRTNAALDAPIFGGGIWKVGTRQEQAVLIMDGREDTFWEPDPSAPLEDWSVEIDLGRLVWAQKVVVKFVREDGENPALEFKLRTSKGPAAFFQRAVQNYSNAGRSQESYSRSARAFTFDLKPSEISDPGFSGDPIRFLQMLFTGRDEGQTTEVSLAEWEALPQAERGAVLYFRRLASGVLQVVDQTAYGAIRDPQHQGPIKYYRQSRVRLAEVEVWGGGDNLSLEVLQRGGQISLESLRRVGQSAGNLYEFSGVIDGDFTTYSWIPIAFRPSDLSNNSEFGQAVQFERSLSLDLGAWYWVNRVLILGDIFGNGGLRNYVIALSEGTPNVNGDLHYSPVATRGQGGGQDELQNRQRVFQDNVFPLTRARYLEVDYRMGVDSSPFASLGTSLREFMVYGAGYLPQVTLSSPPIELGATPRVLSTLAWDAEISPGTQLQVRTRTGDQMVPQVHYFNKNGGEVTQAQYHKLVSFLRGDSSVVMVPGPDWSNWSEVYPAPGSTITSPSPRRYAMIEATLLSDDPNQAVLLRRLSLGLKTILASQVVGEVSPGKVSHNGQREEFTLYVRPHFQTGDQGFDQVLVALPPEAEAEVIDLRVGAEWELAAGEGKRYGPEALQRVESSPDSLWLRLPAPILPGQELVALRFSAVLYQASTPFTTSVGLDTGGETTWQWVDAGEATALGDGQGLTVFTPFEPEFLGAVEVSPNPFTPNGDGINEQVSFTVPVYKVLGDKVLVLEVYSLDGRRVRRVARWASPAVGVHQLAWDGRDQDGELAPPGLYLCRVGLSVDALNIDQPQITRLVASVY